jgi:hypothetical protein
MYEVISGRYYLISRRGCCLANYDGVQGRGEPQPQEGYTPQEVRWLMHVAKEYGFEDDWTEDEAAVFFNRLGFLMAEVFSQRGRGCEYDRSAGGN